MSTPEERARLKARFWEACNPRLAQNSHTTRLIPTLRSVMNAIFDAQPFVIGSVAAESVKIFTTPQATLEAAYSIFMEVAFYLPEPDRREVETVIECFRVVCCYRIGSRTFCV